MPSELKSNIKKNPNMKHLLREVGGYWGMVGSSESYFSAFAIALKASEFQIALLNSLPQVLSGLSQLLGLNLINRGINRLQIIVLSSMLQIISLIIMALLPFMFKTGQAINWALIGIVIIYFSSLYVHVPAWTSLYRELIPEKIRASFSGYRSQVGLIILFVSYSSAGLILDLAAEQGNVFWGYLVIFLAAVAFRSYSTNHNSQLSCTTFEKTTESNFTFRQFLRRMPRSRFGKFVIFSSLMNMSILIALSFTSVYLLRGLELSYLNFMLITAVASICQFATVLSWGNLIDRIGNLKVLHITSFLLAAIPFAFIASTDLVWLFSTFILIGIAVAGYNLACFNYIFLTVAHDKIPRCTAYQSLVQGVFHLFGALIGSAIYYATEDLRLDFLSEPKLTPFVLIFLASGIMRILCSLLFLKTASTRKTALPEAEQQLDQPQ